MKIKVFVNSAEMKVAFLQAKRKFNQAVKEGIQDVNGPKVVQDSYDNSPLRVESRRLYDSFKEKNTKNSKTVSSNVPYAEIQDRGGVINHPGRKKGRKKRLKNGGGTYRIKIKPTYYFTNAIKLIQKALVDAITEAFKKK